MTIKKTNKTAMIVLILGLSTIILPLYMTIVIAFKQPSEMTNSISGIPVAAQGMEPEQFQGSHGDHKFLAFLKQQLTDHGSDRGTVHRGSFPDGLCAGT